MSVCVCYMHQNVLRQNVLGPAQMTLFFLFLPQKLSVVINDTNKADHHRMPHCPLNALTVQQMLQFQHPNPTKEKEMKKKTKKVWFALSLDFSVTCSRNN